MKHFWLRGEPQVIATAAALGITLLLTLTLVIVVLVNGMGFFWPAGVARAVLKDGTVIAGEITAREMGQPPRLQFKVGNRDLYGQDFRWVDRAEITSLSYPSDLIVLERKEHGNFYGFTKTVSVDGEQAAAGGDPAQRLDAAWEQVAGKSKTASSLDKQVSDLTYQAERIRQQMTRLSHDDRQGNTATIAALKGRLDGTLARIDGLAEQQNGEATELRRATVTVADASGTGKEIPIADIVRIYRPNSMTVWAKTMYYLERLRELLFDEPRESNTEGGLFPAIFGTVMMVLLMTLFSLPFGVIAAVYLREYAQEGFLVRMVRIAVNNLAGVPSIVYGVFGLGFFVYGIGSGMDRLFYPERLPTPTFGTGGILWSSLTLALLTVPVIIVATEESLAAIPKGIREGSLSLGATKFQTLTRLLLPMATPGIMTGMILSMARAAGEVAPLMLVGVVKLAPSLPLDMRFPYFHMDRKFMHLGFHIYDVGFQSPNVEAAKPMVYVTTLLLLAIVIAASSSAIYLRTIMKKRYTTRTF